VHELSRSRARKVPAPPCKLEAGDEARLKLPPRLMASTEQDGGSDAYAATVGDVDSSR
jgi:hypothetical protein